MGSARRCDEERALSARRLDHGARRPPRRARTIEHGLARAPRGVCQSPRSTRSCARARDLQGRTLAIRRTASSRSAARRRDVEPRESRALARRTSVPTRARPCRVRGRHARDPRRARAPSSRATRDSRPAAARSRRPAGARAGARRAACGSDRGSRWCSRATPRPRGTPRARRARRGDPRGTACRGAGARAPRATRREHAIITAALSPARFHVFDADVSTIERRAAAAETEGNGR